MCLSGTVLGAADTQMNKTYHRYLLHDKCYGKNRAVCKDIDSDIGGVSNREGRPLRR